MLKLFVSKSAPNCGEVSSTTSEINPVTNPAIEVAVTVLILSESSES